MNTIKTMTLEDAKQAFHQAQEDYQFGFARNDPKAMRSAIKQRSALLKRIGAIKKAQMAKP
jgi:hypothetical protein